MNDESISEGLFLFIVHRSSFGEVYPLLRVNRVRAAACAVLVFVASMCATVPHHQKRLPRLEELSLDEKIGQLFAVGAHGVFMGESSPAYQQLLHQARDNHVGGII